MKLLPALEFEVHGKTMDLWMRIFKLVPCPIWLMYAHAAAYDIDIDARGGTSSVFQIQAASLPSEAASWVRAPSAVRDLFTVFRRQGGLPALAGNLAYPTVRTGTWPTGAGV